MSIQRRPLLRDRLLWLALASILPLTLVAGIGLAVIVTQQRASAERTTLDLARAMGTAVQAELGGSIAVLEAMLSSPLLDEDRFEAYEVLMQRILSKRPEWYAIFLADSDGKPLARAAQSGGGNAQGVVAVAEPESFQRILQSGKPQVGSLVRGPMGRFAVPVRAATVTRSGRKIVITAVLGPQTIGKVLEQQRLPADYVVSVFDSKNVRVARTLMPPGAIGGQPTPSLQALLSQHKLEGVGTTTSLEGAQVFTAFWRLPDSGWNVSVGVPPSSIVSSAWPAFAAYGGAIAVLLLLSLVLARRVSRSISEPIAQLGVAALAVGRGEVPEIGIDGGLGLAEVDLVASNLRAAAEARQRTEALLHEADRRKDEFLATLSHELRNPLAPIRQAAFVLAAPQATAEQRQRCRAIIERQVTHMSMLLEDLMDVARITRGVIALRKQSCRLREVLNEALDLAKATIEGHQHRLRVDVAGAPEEVDADPVRLAQIVTNLLTNAAKYTPPGGHIELRAMAAGDALVIEVQDDGSGIAPANLEVIFEMFTQLPAEPGTLVNGLGIGLSLSRQLAQLHGGTLVACSAGLGQGSTFTLRMPLRSA